MFAGAVKIQSHPCTATNIVLCTQCKKATDALVAAERKKDAQELLRENSKDKHTEEFLKFERFKKEGGPAWIALVMEYRAKCPALGRGHQRLPFDTLTFIERVKASQVMRKGFKAVFMLYGKYLEFAQEVEKKKRQLKQQPSGRT